MYFSDQSLKCLSCRFGFRLIQEISGKRLLKFIQIQLENPAVRAEPDIKKPVCHSAAIRSFDDWRSYIGIIAKDLLIFILELQQVEMLMKEVDFRDAGGTLSF